MGKICNMKMNKYKTKVNGFDKEEKATIPINLGDELEEVDLFLY